MTPEPRLSEEEIEALEKLERQATPSTSLMMDRYDHGGGRHFVPGDERLRGEGRKLVADYYHKEDRELFDAMRGSFRRLLAEVRLLRQEKDEAYRMVNAMEIGRAHV